MVNTRLGVKKLLWVISLVNKGEMGTYMGRDEWVYAYIGMVDFDSNSSYQGQGDLGVTIS